jgi:hypothetical protein
MAGPTWVRLDTGYFSNPKILRAGTDAALLHLAAICYLGAHELDAGILPGEALDLVASMVRVKRPHDVVRRLCDNKLWHCHDGGWLIHHYDIMNGENSEGAAARRRQRAKRMRDAKQRDDWLDERDMSVT